MAVSVSQSTSSVQSKISKYEVFGWIEITLQYKHYNVHRMNCVDLLLFHLVLYQQLRMTVNILVHGQIASAALRV